ncbi:MAG: phosphatase PAP2 family protein [Verrucomicrobiota bacterium]|nr:phosphatase PAP2 family protein [Verrucomicrobiota bacterium]
MSTPGSPHRRFEREVRFLRNRLSPEGYLGLHLTIGLLVIFLGCWMFADIAGDIRPGKPLFAFDQQVTNWFHAHARSGLTKAAWVMTDCGSVGFVTTASVAFALLLLFRRTWDRLLAFALTMVGGSALNIILKHIFHRQRPVLENPLVTLSSWGFPSGHTMGSTLFYGFLALLAATAIQHWRLRAVPFLSAAVMVAAVGWSRIYLGAHYLSDVLAAIAAGAAWLSLCWTAVDIFRRRRRSQQTVKKDLSDGVNR